MREFHQILTVCLGNLSFFYLLRDK